ncbi:hypothetical protein AB0I81_35930 [Nonomuraea sp. NPDC050404]|uniref:hypothetical protein n=1 Tax=Nonomuraea sp. NPDC050404 TaxID=3155783 RepID=UPI00340BC7AA
MYKSQIDRRSGRCLALTGLGVTAFTTNREAAITWIDWVTSPEGAGAVAKESPDLPVCAVPKLVHGI